MTPPRRLNITLALLCATQILTLGRGDVDGPSRLLGRCETGCKRFDDCQIGFSCYKRTRGEVTNCQKGKIDVGETYCSEPRPQKKPKHFDGQLIDAGNGGEPMSVFPLELCSGDCDGDKQCQLGLVCYQRNATEAVPHCKGRGIPGDDYCTLPKPGQLVVKGVKGSPKAAYPLGKCEGSCTSSLDCASGLVCYHRKKKAEIPGCSGEGISDESYCHVPPPAELVSVIRSGKTLLTNCQGDCTSDRHCDLGLACSERLVGTEKLPGCSGRGVHGKDYCYVPPSGHFVITSPPGGKKGNLRLCHGECVSDEDCLKGLSCLTKKGRKDDPFCKGRGVAGRKYCYPKKALPVTPVETTNPKFDELAEVGTAPFPICRGPCSSDKDCRIGLSCYKRRGLERVPGCKTLGKKGVQYCYKPPAGVLVSKIGGQQSSSSFPLAACRGECSTDADCDLGLSCYRRKGTEPVPNCKGAGIPGVGYCYEPPQGTHVLKAMNHQPRSAFPLGMCEGECESQNDCQPGLLCMQRTGNQVLGCEGKGILKKNYCYRPFLAPPKENVLVLKSCSRSSPCDACQGDCKNNSRNCRRGTVCVPRNSRQSPIPGCEPGGSGDSIGKSYCSKVTYVPGDATQVENGLLLSTGLQSRVLAQWKKPVRLADGTLSKRKMHEDPDGAAIFKDEKTGGWIYVSNSEASKGGGVGALVFNKDGEVTDYKWLLGDTKRNCGGGKTWYNTWISCEEVEGGHIWEVDPWDKNKARKTLIGLEEGDMYEAAAYDNRNKRQPKIFVTTDKFDGPVLRYSPDNRAVREALVKNDYRDLLHKNETGTAITEYLLLKPSSRDPTEGTFSWTDRINVARENASANYNHCEGIDMRDGMLYFTCKKRRHLFILDLDKQTYRRSSTRSGAFDNGPDQVARILGDGDAHDILYFCEEGGKICGVHGRDKQGNYYTVLESSGALEDETSGLAFSPDNMRMYLSFQAPGLIFEITRKDGHPFGGQRLDIKYHTDKPFAKQ